VGSRLLCGHGCLYESCFGLLRSPFHLSELVISLRNLFHMISNF
jgi:hypothetical protein